MQCWEEYISLVAQFSQQMRVTLEGIKEGTIEEFNYERKNAAMDKINSSSGGALAKSMPLPKQVQTEEEKRFVANMNDREKELKNLYEGLRKQGPDAGQQLLNMVKNGSLKPDERDKLGLCPFLFAIDASMDLDIIQKLVTDGGCDIESTDAEGDTALHYAVNLDNEELQQWLIEKVGEEFKEVRNSSGLRAYDDDE